MSGAYAGRYSLAFGYVLVLIRRHQLRLQDTGTTLPVFHAKTGVSMKNIRIILWIGVFLLFCTPATGYTIDGDLSDWGLSGLNAGDWSKNETWIPAKGVSFIVEDNVNPRFSSDYQGVHIKGTGAVWEFFNEQKRIHTLTEEKWIEPYGGEKYDMEAYYFDQDSDSIYIAIVTSLKPDGSGDLCPMDIGLNFGQNPVMDDLGYEYGVKIREDALQGSIIYNPAWKNSGYIIPEKPDLIQAGTGTYVGRAEISYNNDWLTRRDNGFENYVIELAIRKIDVGITGDIQFGCIFYSDSRMDEFFVAPEFPGIAVSLAIITGLASIIYLFREKI